MEAAINKKPAGGMVPGDGAAGDQDTPSPKKKLEEMLSDVASATPGSSSNMAAPLLSTAVTEPKGSKRKAGKGRVMPGTRKAGKWGG